MNAQDRRSTPRARRRALPVSLGCHHQGYSGIAGYPDLMCTDGHMSDMDADGDDPSVARPPCPNCNAEKRAEWDREQNEFEEDA